MKWSGKKFFTRKSATKREITAWKASIPQKRGIYLLRLKGKKKPKVLRRVGGIDREFRLYYGSAIGKYGLQARIGWCLSSFNQKLSKKELFSQKTHTGLHTAVKTYKMFFPNTRWFEKGLIQVCWKISKDARKKEAKLIRKYREHFMDNLPLNSQGRPKK